MYSIDKYFGVIRDVDVSPDIGATLTKVRKEKCGLCGRSIVGSGDHQQTVCRIENPDGEQMPDSIGVNDNIWSERVVALMKSSKLTGFRASRLKVEPSPGSILPSQRLEYHAIDFVGRVEISREHFDANDGQACPGCGFWKPTRGGSVGYGDKIVALKSEGVELPDFAVGQNVCGRYYLCSAAFVELVREHVLTGFLFVPTAPRLRRIDTGSSPWLENFRAEAKTVYPELVGRSESFEQKKPV